MKKIKELLKKVVNYVKETAWIQPLLFVLAIMALIMAVSGVTNAVGCTKDGVKNLYSCACKDKDEGKIYKKILGEDALEKIKDGDDFVLYIGYESCSGCQAFEPVLKRYAKDYPNKKVYYLSIQQNDEGEYKDATLTKDILQEIQEYIEEILGPGLATPTVAAFRDGKCVDAKVGGGVNGISVSDLVSLYNKAKGIEE